MSTFRIILHWLSLLSIGNMISYYSSESESCLDDWSSHSSSAGNPDIPYVVVSKSSIVTAVCKEILGCYRKVVLLMYFLLSENRRDLETEAANANKSGAFCSYLAFLICWINQTCQFWSNFCRLYSQLKILMMFFPSSNHLLLLAMLITYIVEHVKCWRILWIHVTSYLCTQCLDIMQPFFT